MKNKIINFVLIGILIFSLMNFVSADHIKGATRRSTPTGMAVTEAPQSITIPLKLGWNLISPYENPIGLVTIRDIFVMSNPYLAEICGWNYELQKKECYLINQSTPRSPDAKKLFSVKNAYWIRVTANNSFSYKYHKIVGPIVINLKTGDNYIGIGRPTATTYSSYLFLKDVTSANAISKFDPVTQQSVQAFRDNTGVISGTDFELNAGEGYIVTVPPNNKGEVWNPGQVGIKVMLENLYIRADKMAGVGEIFTIQSEKSNRPGIQLWSNDATVGGNVFLQNNDMNVFTGSGDLVLTGGKSGTAGEGIIFNTWKNNGAYERMRIDTEGNVGIGTSSPTTKLSISQGDAYISTPGTGLIVKSPDGQICKKIGIDDGGNIIATSLTCPLG